MSEKHLSGFALLLPGGGSGSRFGTEKNKLLHDLAGMPVFLHSIRTLAPLFDEILMTVSEQNFSEFQSAAGEFLPEVPIRFLPGGRSRAESVHILAEAAKSPYFAIHDAARPLIRPAPVIACADTCIQYGAAILCHPVTDTIKQADCSLQADRTIPRDSLYGAETPQMFERKIFLQAIRIAADSDYAGCTDDASVPELFGLPDSPAVHLVVNDTPNPKITHAADLIFCEVLLKNKN